MATGKTAMPLDDTHGVHHGGGVGAVSGAAAEAAHVERSLSALSLAAAGARAAPAAAAAAPAPASAAAASSSQAAPGSEVKATEASAAAAYPAHAGRADGQGKATEAQAHDSDVKTSSASDGGAPDAAGGDIAGSEEAAEATEGSSAATASGTATPLVPGRIYVGNLPWTYDDAVLASVFAHIGEVVDSKIIYDRGTRRSKGFGFVTFANSEHAQVAIETMHLTSLGGRVVKVSHADPIGTAPRRSVPRPPPGQAQPGAYAYPAAGMQGSYAPPPPPFGYAPPATGYVQAAPAAASGAPVAYTVDAAASTAHFHGSPVVSESLSPTHHAPPVGYATGMGVTTPKAAAAVGFPMVAIPSSPAGPVAQHGPGSPMSGGSPMGYQPVFLPHGAVFYPGGGYAHVSPVAYHSVSPTAYGGVSPTAYAAHGGAPPPAAPGGPAGYLFSSGSPLSGYTYGVSPTALMGAAEAAAAAPHPGAPVSAAGVPLGVGSPSPRGEQSDGGSHASGDSGRPPKHN